MSLQVDEERNTQEEVLLEEDEHVHYSQRAPWLRAFVLGANDGLVSVAALMMGVGGGSSSLDTMRLSAVAAWIGGALSMAVGEYISIASQKDSEEADIQKERDEQAKGPEYQQRELEELAQIYINRGVSPSLARLVAIELTAKDVIRAHARDELGIDMDDLSNPFQAALVSALAFTMGAAFPLLAGVFIADQYTRLYTVLGVSTFGLILFGFVGAVLGGSNILVGSMRVIVGGLIALGITYGVGYAIGGG